MKDDRAANQNCIKIMAGMLRKMTVFWNFCINVGEDNFKGTVFSKIYLVHIVFLFNQSKKILNGPFGGK